MTVNLQAAWQPGGAHGLVWRSGAAVLDAGVPMEVAARVWRLVATDPSLTTWLETLADQTGAGYLHLPPFAMVVWSVEGIHVAARGTGLVTAHTTAGAVEVSGDGATTWLEKRLDATCSLLHLGLGAVEASPVDAPLLGGVVTCGSISLRSDATVASDDRPLTGGARDVSSPQVTLDPPTPREEVPLEELSRPGSRSTDLQLQDQGDRGFDHLWSDKTSHQPLAAAAVRDQEDEPVPVQPTEHSPEPEAQRGDDTRQVEADSSVWEEVWHGDDDSVASEDVPEFISHVPSAAGLMGTSDTSSPPAHAPSERAGDHAGDTIMTLDDSAGPQEDEPPPASGVLAIACPDGHLNPTHRSRCRVCDEPTVGTPQRMSQPTLGYVVTNGGERTALDRSVVIGRDPSANRFQGVRVPHLVMVAHRHVSKNHLELRVDGWSVEAVDLNSTNGTFLVRPGQGPMRLPSAPLLLGPGDVLDLGHGVTLQFEELP